MKWSADLQGFIRNWPTSCLNDSETKEKGVKEVKIRKIPEGENAPGPP